MQAMRTEAGLDQGELAARAHYPRDVIAAAESALPELPVLAAYVRGCGGTGDDMVEWEDRWRSVTGEAASPVLSARVAGLSGAAAAGARLSEVSPPVSPEEQGPTVVLSALHRFAERMAQPTGSAPGSPDGTGTATGRAETVRASGDASGESEASGTSVTGVDGVTEVAARDGAGTGATISGSGDSAGQERLVPLQRMPREESGEPGGLRSGASGRTIAVTMIAAALLCLLIVLLAF
jgi:hypothetical protein